MRLGLVGRVLLGAGVPTLLAVAAFVTMLGAVQAVREAQVRVSGSQNAVIAAEGLSRAVGDVAIGERDTVLGERADEDLRSAPRQRVRDQIAALHTATTGAADNGIDATDVISAADAYLTSTGDAAASSGRLPDADGPLLDDFTERLDAFLARERQVAAAQERQATTASRWAVSAAAVGLVTSLLAVVLVGGYLTRTVTLPVRRAAALARRFADGDLDARLRVSGVGEVGGLQRALNEMATSLTRARTELTASRARIAAAGYHERRMIERDLHDGLQQRLVSLALDVRGLRADAPDDLRPQVDEVVEGLVEATDELRDFVRGIQPAALTEHGLGAAVRALARRAALPVEVTTDLADRLPPDVESAAYYFVSEALTNATKHARASYVEVSARVDAAVLTVVVRDDGVGGADPTGDGLVGLADRIEAAGGWMGLVSEAGQGTTLTATIPTPGQAGVAATG
ncbi:HAMP domain-containing protein [Micromonospora sp. NPDC049366]|uniref:sensor histidine kinase n=1 Tax=Micromonospora sp. NPDC049366 TaxID=3364271 RepID=UPI0037A74120